MQESNFNSFEEYWIGKDINYEQLWKNYNSGELRFREKFHSTQTSGLKINFNQPLNDDPLFNIEAIHKTVQGFHHDVKKFCFTEEEYRNSVPIFVYEIERGSAEWIFKLGINSIPLLIMGIYRYYLHLRKLELGIESDKLDIELKKGELLARDLKLSEEMDNKLEQFPSSLTENQQAGFSNLVKYIKNISGVARTSEILRNGKQKITEVTFNIEFNEPSKTIEKKETETLMKKNNPKQ